MENEGNTPKKWLDIDTCYELRDTPLPIDFSFPDHRKEIIVPAMLGPKGLVDGLFYDLFGEDLQMVSEGIKHFYVWGSATYLDVFEGTPIHVTRFCGYIRHVSGDPLREFDRESNLVGIVFGVYECHNCADEECEDS